MIQKIICSLIFLCLTPTISYSQNSEAEVVYKDGTIVKGTVPNINYLKYTKKIEFAANGKGRHKSIEISKVDYVNIENKGRYEVLVTEEGDENIEKIFLARLKGAIDLLYHDDEEIYVSKDGNIQRLASYKERGVLREPFRSTLAEVVNHDQEFIKLIQEAKFKKSHIESIVDKYNSRFGSSKEILINTNSPTRKRIQIGGGIRKDPTMEGNTTNELGKNHKTTFATIELSLSDSDISDILALNVGLWYVKDSYIIPSLNYSYNATSIVLPLYVEVNDWRSFVSYYGAFGVSGKKINMERTLPSEYLANSKITGNLILEFGVALNVVDKLNIMFTYNVDTQTNLKARFRF